MARQRLLPIAFVIALLAGVSFSIARAPAEAADVSVLLTHAGTAAKSGDHAAAIEALEEALEKVRVEAPLTVKPFLLVTQPARFYGDYTPRANAVFQGGEPQQFYPVHRARRELEEDRHGDAADHAEVARVPMQADVTKRGGFNL